MINIFSSFIKLFMPRLCSPAKFYVIKFVWNIERSFFIFPIRDSPQLLLFPNWGLSLIGKIKKQPRLGRKLKEIFIPVYTGGCLVESSWVSHKDVQAYTPLSKADSLFLFVGNKISIYTHQVGMLLNFFCKHILSHVLLFFNFTFY